MYLNLIDDIIAQHEIDEYLIWIIIDLGLIIELDFGTENFFYF